VPIFYKGAGPATYWHQNNAIDDGFVSCKPGHIPSDDLMIDHIINGNTNSPYISLTRSFGVALNYAMFGEEAMADENDPGYVYEIEIAEPLPDGLVLIDPVKQLAQSLPSPTAS